ncbi:threonine/serine exporter family protein [Gephyromycinifex aptenodytis]|uniref:threonine/serine ThrE exporter family protein n=1 Tax=Gephyromycinifex aptenodytis TaxID=2716227 RepID=UPI0014476F2A|nr:threonine/serine exporter family protein [Gephyromycinifex aptenodytis]
MGGAFLRRAKDAVRAVDAPTWGLDLKEINDGIEHARSRSVIDLAMRIAESTLATGASAADVTANVLSVTKAYGLRSVHVDVTFTAITVTHHRGPLADPVTMVRTVRVRTADYERLARTYALITDITDNGLPLEEARGRFERIMERPPAYRRGVVTLSFALLGAGVAALLGGNLTAILLAAIIVGIVDRCLMWTARQRLTEFFGQMVGGAIPAAIAMFLVASRDWLPDFLLNVNPSLLVSTGIVVQLAGLSVVGAAQDAIDGFYVTASARTFEVVVLTLGLLVGVIGVITIASRLGTPAYVIPPSAVAPYLVVQILAVAMIAASFAIGTYAGPRTILVSVAMAVIGWSAYAFFLSLDLDRVSSTAVACVVVGFLSQLSAGRFAVPSLALATAGIVGFLPGGMVFRALYYMVETPVRVTAETNGPNLLMGAIATGLAIAGGVSLGGYLGWQVRGGDRARDRVKDKALRSTAPIEEEPARRRRRPKRRARG